MSKPAYSHIIDSKDEHLIPICKNALGKEIALHSKYNPIREAEQFANQVNESLFFVVLGLGGGYHIEKLSEKFPKAKILVAEISDEAIDFLKQIPEVIFLSQNKKIRLSSIQNLAENLLSFYKPALYGNLSILSLRSWETLFADEAALAQEKINSAVKLLSGDFSVQSHFGKIWQKNILTNLKSAEKTKNFTEILRFAQKNEITQKKIAAIIAAGPSLDDAIVELKQNREQYFIIATDTAFSALTKQGIESDSVISIDGQMISHEHYLEKIGGKTLFVFDLCSPAASVRKNLAFTKNVLFAETGHPLSQYASFFDGEQHFIHLEAGSGTVTIAAASFAHALGFPNDRIKFFGADFSYIGGKPYARGTYFETKFYSKSNRFESAEKSYTKLMYRTPVSKISEHKITTEILDSYRLSLRDFMKKNPTESNKIQQNPTKFNFHHFKSQYRKELGESFKSETDFDEESRIVTTLLPFIAKMGKDSAFLAYLKILEYTERV